MIRSVGTFFQRLFLLLLLFLCFLLLIGSFLVMTSTTTIATLIAMILSFLLECCDPSGQVLDVGLDGLAAPSLEDGLGLRI